MSIFDLASIDTALDSRAVTFENPTGRRGEGGREGHGRKGAPSRRLAPGERVVLADIDGPGTVRHIWMTSPPAPPEVMRALLLEIFYDGQEEPSVSVPALDFFGLPHGRPVAYSSAVASAQEGRGFNSYVPIPFGGNLRIEVENSSDRALELYFQVDLTLEDARPQREAGVSGFLHATFRRQNPTVMGDDFVITEGLRGAGRFAGCVVGVRVLDEGSWYGEGEVKVYRDGDGAWPTICGTGLEDYVGSAWGMGPHHAPYAGAPLEVRARGSAQPDFVGFYRWHLPDPVVFHDDLRVTIQQIGMHAFAAGMEDEFTRYAATHPAAGAGWQHPRGLTAFGICERVDDYCATAFVYCTEPQSVRRLDVVAAVADIDRLPYEQPLPLEALFAPRVTP